MTTTLRGAHAALPSTYTVLLQPAIRALRATLSHEILVALIHHAKTLVCDVATRAQALDEIVRNVVHAAGLLTLSPRELINATGVAVHTGLGTAPLSTLARERMLEAAGATATGAEGFDDRTALAEHFLCTLTGAEEACVTDQTAAACVLVGAALGPGREIVCAAQDLLEISHGIRLRDLFESTGAKVVPVGSANCVTLQDYARALTTQTRILMRVWHSNYVTHGYVSHVDPLALAGLAHEHQLRFVVNLGAGSLVDLRDHQLPYSPTLQGALAWGANLVLASSDKLVGGPQAGLIVGQRRFVQELAAHPLYRAVRPSKLTIAALEGTLASYLAGRAWEEIPVLRMISAPVDSLRERAEAIAAAVTCAPLQAEAVSDTAYCGGAILPDRQLATWGVRLTSPRYDVEALYDRLAGFGVIGRRTKDAALVDLRSVLPEDDRAVTAALGAVAHYHPSPEET